MTLSSAHTPEERDDLLTKISVNKCKNTRGWTGGYRLSVKKPWLYPDDSVFD
jgi:hypothetical protein